MALWLTTPVTNQPSLTLKNWSVIELPDGGRHFVGYCVENREGRVSSLIKLVDPSTLRGSTATGRVYQLAGAPGQHPDAQYVLANWLSLYRLSTWTDVTDALWHAHLSAPAVTDGAGIRSGILSSSPNAETSDFDVLDDDGPLRITP